MTLPDDAVREAERLTRLAREASDPDEAAAHRERRDALLSEHGYVVRVRSDDTADVLVLHPSDWLDDDGTVRLDRVDDVGRGREVPLSGPGDTDDWAATEAHNRAVAERVDAEHGAVHGRTAHAFADFASNHYAKRVEATTPGEVSEFVEEYLPRNAWPSDEQLELVEETVELVVETAEETDAER